MAGKYNITIEQGATYTKTFTWKDSDGNAVDLTGYSGRMHIRENYKTEDVLLDVEPYMTLGGAAGTISITISDDITSALTFDSAVYDLELEDSDGVVTRLLEGSVTLSKEVTK